MIDRSQLQTVLESDFLERSFPVFNSPGIKDEDVMIHSLGCSVWNTLGHELGFMAVVEGPAPIASGNDIRSDSVWFDKADNTPLVLIEFERYDGTDRGYGKLEEKLGNLMEASMRWGDQPTLLVLSAWSPGLVSAPDFERLELMFRRGFSNSKGAKIPAPTNCQLLLHRLVLSESHTGLLQLQRMNFRWS
ncbi:MAG: hypothetical protein DRR42_01545 [Gammaproteobacteria bacterium]|nr:MAG: hypothetical protein DRR42_01545 [Gammaproteobacteria bacterium]